MPPRREQQLAQPVTASLTIEKPRFVEYYWLCLKYFGERLWTAKGSELVSAFVFAACVFIASLFFSDAGAAKAFEISVVALVGWLTCYAIAHIFRTPWLLHREKEEKTHWGFGLAGIAMLALIALEISGVAIWFYEAREPRLEVKSADPAAQNAEIAQLKEKIKSLANKPGGERKPSLASTARVEGAFFEPIQVLLDCSPIYLPITIPAGTTAHVIALNKQANAHARFFYNDIRAEGRAPKLWPDSLMQQEGAVKCSVLNHGNSNLTDLEVPLEIRYGGPSLPPITHSAYINPLDKGQTFSFYLVNTCPIETSVHTLLSGIAKVVGEDAPRKFNFERPQSYSSENFGLNPGKVSWTQMSCE